MRSLGFSVHIAYTLRSRAELAALCGCERRAERVRRVALDDFTPPCNLRLLRLTYAQVKTQTRASVQGVVPLYGDV